VTLTVLDHSDPAPRIDPVGLIFTGASTATQSISITNRSEGSLTFESNAYFAGGHAWFTVQPASGMLNSGQTQQINIQPNVTDLPSGAVYSGQLNLGFSDNSAQQVNLFLVVPPGAPAAAKGQHAALNCTPSSLMPVITSLGGESLVAVGRATPVQVQVVDNCGGTPETSGSMQLNFNNGDPAVELLSLPGGLWTGTITPRNSASGALEISVHGQIGSELTLPNSVSINFDAPSTQPVLLPYGVSSAASYAPQAPMAPGSLINIYGSALADHSGQFSGLPLPTAIAGTQVLLGGKALPLMSVSPDRIIAQTPYEINVNTAQQLVVRRGLNQSAPETLPIASAQPAMFTVNQQGNGQAIATIGNTSVLADASHPAKAGDTIIIYCSGLGAVDPHVQEGSAAPSNPLSQTQTPQVMIGGKPARVAFSGLTPGFAGLYQINAVVPDGIASGNEVPIVLIVAGQTSPTVTIAVR
jgi:adhesin/invasin